MIGIVAHTKRATAAHTLQDQTHAAYVTIDNGELGCRGNHLKAWNWLEKHAGPDPKTRAERQTPGMVVDQPEPRESHEAGAGADPTHEHGTALTDTIAPTWCVVIEDDAIPVPDFNKHLDEVLALAPTPVVSLYLGKLRPPQYQAWIKYATERADLAEPPASWIISPDLFHAVGVCIRHDLVADMLDSIKDLTSIGGDMMPTPAPIDQAISWWAKEREHQISYVYPSLVDHADGETVEQHADGQPREPGRIAWKTGYREPWTQSKVSM